MACTPTLPAVVEEWTEQAACRHVDPEVFFPVSERGPAVERAKAVCRSCLVRSDCLEDACARDERHGVWGGLTEAERRKYQRRRAA